MTNIPVGPETYQYILTTIGDAFAASHWLQCCGGDQRAEHDSAAREHVEALDTAEYALRHPPTVNALSQLTACFMRSLAQDGRERLYDLRPSRY
jgi:hypothetical protein